METLHAFEETLRALREGAKLCVPGAIEGKVHLDFTPEGWTVTVLAITRDAEGTYTHTLYHPSVVLPDLSNVLRNATASITARLAGIRREAEDRLRDVERSITELMGGDLEGPLGWTGAPETCGARLPTGDGSLSVRVEGKSAVIRTASLGPPVVLSPPAARALSALLRQCYPHIAKENSTS